jgi:hypothetical protein
MTGRRLSRTCVDRSAPAKAHELLEHLRNPAALAAEVQHLLGSRGRLVGAMQSPSRPRCRLVLLAGRAPEEGPTLLRAV